MERRRDVSARFFKPVCLLAVIDGISQGELAPSDLDLDRVCARFAAYVSPEHADRAQSGWRPFWHLGRDGAWRFTMRGAPVGPEDFGRARKPNGRAELERRTDLAAVPAEDRAAWRSTDARAELRRAVLAIMSRDDDEACKWLARKLASPPGPDIATDLNIVAEAASARGPDAADQGGAGAPRRVAPGQGFATSAPARRAIEVRAMALATRRMETEGWRVTDVSARESFDLLCARDGATLRVEVKGTTGDGTRVLVTAAEAAAAQADPSGTALVVVSALRLKTPDGPAEGGEVWIVHPWRPGPDSLEAVSYWHAVPGATSAATRGEN